MSTSKQRLVNEATEAFSLFFGQFGKIDTYTSIVLEELFKELLTNESVPVSSQERQERVEAVERVQLREANFAFEGAEHFRLELAEGFGIGDTTEH